MTGNGFKSNNLIEAIHAGCLSGVVTALADGDDIELPDMHGYNGLPLRTACFEGNLAIVRELLTHGANPNAASCDGPGAPLRLALRRGHQDIADLLRQTGALPTGELVGTPEIESAPLAPLPGEAAVPNVPASEPNNIIEYSASSLPLPSSEARTPSLSDSQQGNTIEFSYSDSHLPTEDEDTQSHFGTDTNAISMELLFLEENEIPLIATPTTDKP